MTKWYQAEIIKIIDETPKTKRFFLSILGEEKFDFRAGQFITMDLPVGEKRLQRWRSYSIASAPKDDNILEFCIGKIEGGLATTYLFEQANIGTTVKFKGPDGNFCLSEDSPDQLVMICTGTGIAPFKSMLDDLVNQQKLNQHIHLIFGTRYEKDILYKAELVALQAKMPNFTFDIALSPEKVEGYHHGYLHNIYMQKYAEKSENIRFLLCGWSQMIDEAVANLLVKLQVEKSQIHYELYG